MIEKIETNNLNFGNLLKKIDRILEADLVSRKQFFAENAIENIKSGKLRVLRPFTKYIRREGLSGTAKGFKSNTDKPLNFTGNLLRSIKVVDEGVKMLKYGLYHQEGFEIVKNEWTKKFLKKDRPSFTTKVKRVLTTGSTFKKINVKPRPFMLTATGNLSPKLKKRMKKLETDLYKAIKRAMRGRA